MTDATLPYLRIEVTVAGAVITPDDKFVGNSMADLTIAFGWRVGDDLTRNAPDAKVLEALRQHIGRVTAVIATQMALNGWAGLGQVEEPMTQVPSTDTGVRVKTSPQRVQVVPIGPEARA